MQTLLTHELWPEIYRRSKTARKTLAAIAYFSSDKKIRLKKGDVLVVDASQTSIAGSDVRLRGEKVFGLAVVRRPTTMHIQRKRSM